MFNLRNMRKPFKIGNKEYKFKKDALSFYKNILNSYEFGEILPKEHFKNIIDLLNYDEGYFDNHAEFKMIGEKSENNKVLSNIRIGKAQFNTKCFELIFENGETDFISYILRINKPKSALLTNFYTAARNATNIDLRSVKLEYFDNYSKKGIVPCQESGIQSKWTELVVDHRQPNTFSIIVDRFIELNKIDLSKIEYRTDNDNFFIFKDSIINKKFQDYHREKAVLRIVRKELNSSRAHQGRLRKMKKDLKIKTKFNI